MKPNKITSAALALALAAVLGTSARAQVVNAPYTEGDLLIGFEQPGDATDYVANLGLASQFINAPSNFSDQLSVTDLDNTFGGTSWSSDSQTNLVNWGVIGASDKTSNITVGGDTLAANTIFYTVGEATPGTQSTAPIQGSSSTQKNWNSNIVTFTTGYAGTLTTGNGTLDGITESASNSSSWSTENGSPKNGFGIGQVGGIQQPSSGSGDGPTDSVLNLYQLNPTFGQSATLLGDFSLSSGGVLTFDTATPAAVPEPSTYALMGMGVGAMFLIWNLRRKKASLV